MAARVDAWSRVSCPRGKRQTGRTLRGSDDDGATPQRFALAAALVESSSTSQLRLSLTRLP